jgi:hypothetical protein
MNGIKWALRVSPEKIRRLYISDAKGIIDNDLLQEVGISFYARAESIIAINKIHTQEVVKCPICRNDVHKSDNKYLCECGWVIGSKELHQTYKGQQATGLSIIEFAKKFIRDWNGAANNPNKQMMAIDFLIHRFHWEMMQKPTRPVAVNYIDGTMTKITDLILELAYSDDITKKENRKEWLENKKLADEIWRR